MYYKGSYFVGNKVITADKKYQILILDDGDLTAEVSKYNGSSLEPGQLSVDLIENKTAGSIINGTEYKPILITVKNI